MDPQVVSVGVARIGDDHGFRVVRHRRPGVRALRQLDAARLAAGIRGVALELHEAAAPLRPLTRIAAPSLQLGPHAGAPGPGLAEQRAQRPLCPGLQLQNWDCDDRLGLFAREQIEVGSLGVLLPEPGREALLVSNNHVLAGQNRGRPGDRIAQPGGPQLAPRDCIARLERFVELRPSPDQARPARGNVAWNRVDAAVARLEPGQPWQPGYLARHGLPRPGAAASPRIGDLVFKVGRSTGLRRGRVVSVGARVGPVPYTIGPCWFRDSFVVESLDARPFSAGGDSGAAVVRDDGEVLGLIYAGNGVQTYACPMPEVLRELGL